MENYLDRFADVICASDEVAIWSDVTLAGKLVIATAGILTVSYAPFEHIVATAKLVIVGITPGEQQAANALCEVRSRLPRGEPGRLRRGRGLSAYSPGSTQNFSRLTEPGAGPLSPAWRHRCPAAVGRSAFRWAARSRGWATPTETSCRRLAFRASHRLVRPRSRPTCGAAAGKCGTATKIEGSHNRAGGDRSERQRHQRR